MEEIAARLRQVREAHGLSQRQLARRSGVSNATISLIEHERTNPSLGLLKKILDAIPLSLADFFGMDLGEDQQVFFTADELLEIGHGAISYRQVGADLSRHSLQILRETLAPGADTGESLLSHDGEEGGVVISGSMELTVGGQRKLLRPGDAYLFNSRMPHRFRNPGRTPCVIISACTPPSF